MKSAAIKTCTTCGTTLDERLSPLGIICPSCALRACSNPEPATRDAHTTWAGVFPQLAIDSTLVEISGYSIYSARVLDSPRGDRAILQVLSGEALETAAGPASLAGRLDHLSGVSLPTIGRVLDGGDLLDAFYLITSIPEGPSLAELMRGFPSTGSWSLERFLDQTRAVVLAAEAEGLDLSLSPETTFLSSATGTLVWTPSLRRAGGHAQRVVELPAAPRAGQQIGPFTLIAPAGEGGFGEVWRARQERPVQREVAVKIVKGGLPSPRVRARFELEQQALARLDHVHIARFLDGGSTPDGRPFFAMEWIEGDPIAVHCRKTRASLEERLDLFRQVCEGVHHAHLKGIIHRDLKPSNVMVCTSHDTAVVKVIDFGIARALEEDSEPGWTRLTRAEEVIGTPASMSPEQADGASGRDLDARTDVYGLGVLLYELLSGVLPFDPKLPVHELRRRIRQDDPPKPSERVPLREESRQLKGDLDWIVMRCMEKDPQRRYLSVSALQQDLQRFTNNEPVEAGPPRVTYRVRKFVRRNWGSVSAVVGLFLVMLGATLFSHRQKQAARAAEALARAQAFATEAEKQKSDRIAGFLLSILKTPQYERWGPEIKMVAVLDEFVSRLRAEKTIPPESQAPLWRAVVDAYSSASLFDPAIDLASESLRFHEEFLGPEHPDTLQARVQWAYSYLWRGNLSEAERLSRQLLATELASLPLGSEPVIDATFLLADVLQKQLRIEEGAEVLRARIALLPDDHSERANLQLELAGALAWIDRTDEAIQLTNEVVTERRGTLGDDHPLTLLAIHRLARVYDASHRHQDTVGVLDPAIPRFERVFGAEHHETLKAKGRLSGALGWVGRTSEALSLSEEAMSTCQRVFGPDNSLTLSMMESHGFIIKNAGRYEEARTIYETTLAHRRVHKEIIEERLPPLVNLMDLYTRTGETKKAIALARELRESLMRNRSPVGRDNEVASSSVGGGVLPALPPSLPSALGHAMLKTTDPIELPDLKWMASWHSVFNLLIDDGEYDLVVPLVEGYLRALYRRVPQEDRRHSLAVENLAVCYSELKRWEDAVHAAEVAVRMTPQSGAVRWYWGHFLWKWGERDRSILVQEGLDAGWPGENVGVRLKRKVDLAECYRLVGQPQIALDMLETIRPQLVELYGWEDRQSRKAVREIAFCHQDLGQWDAAIRIYREMIPFIDGLAADRPPDRDAEEFGLLWNWYLGKALNENGQHREAIEVLEALIPRIPGDVTTPWKPGVMGILAKAYGDLGRTEEEARMWSERRRLTFEHLEEVYARTTSDTERTAKVVIFPDSIWRWNRPAREESAQIAARFARPDYDDSGWSEAADSLLGGFGWANKEDTWIEEIDIGNPNPDSDHPHAPVFFRLRFTTTEPHDHLELIAQMDDGAVVFLDGAEVGRDNVRSGENLADLYAVECQEAWTPRRIPLDGRLEPGEHVLAISLHSHDCQAHDIRMAGISLVAWSAPRRNPLVAWSHPNRAKEPAAAGLVEQEAGPFEAVDFAETMYWLSLRETRQGDRRRACEALVLSMIGHSLLDEEGRKEWATKSLPELISEWKKLSKDQDNASEPERLLLIERGGDWKFHPCGEGAAAPAGWTSPGFDDSPWESGAAPLGYGDDAVVCKVASGAGPAGKPRTVLFRKAFVAGAIQDAFLGCHLRADDGAAVYLNGKEVHRLRLAEGQLDPSVFATKGVAGDEEVMYVGFVIPAHALVPGENVIAVEVHQVDPESSDILFDLELEPVSLMELRNLLATFDPQVVLGRIRRTYTLKIQDLPSDWRERVERRLNSLAGNTR